MVLPIGATLRMKLVYIRYVKEGEVCTSFVRIVPVENANAPGLLDCIEAGLTGVFGNAEDVYIKL